MQGRPATAIGQVDLSTGPDESAGDAGVTLFSGNVQRGKAIGVFLLVDVRPAPGGKEGVEDPRASPFRSGVQQGSAILSGEEGGGGVWVDSWLRVWFPC